ncbi:bolA-like protein 3 [Centruroides vittatus]|uniref:bolA-like protein 3 n=1 Tax=Centruroides vittatus TaxID=120091 RepID=UPI0035102BD5
MARFLSKLRQAMVFKLSQKTFSTNGEQVLTKLLHDKFPKAATIKVSDISGGCGSMFEISIESKEFHGKSRVQQHMMVNQALKNEIKDMHGLRIFTSVPES